VGASGSGKSTILDLLLRFYDPSAGTIRIDGTDIRDISTDAYRRMFGTVSQETVLFNDTVTRNIALGEATPDIARVEQVARIAHAHDFITAMPEGYQTTIGDRGIKLSGGQRQRLAIARALYRDPDILLFDEATSALDTSSERIVQEAINDVLAGRTAVVVAHRLSTIINADIILVFDQGHIVERGTHTELLAAQGTYAKLYDLQFGTDHASGQ
jgi:ATP-binding cassette subfamily B protein/subfamily B ATP-binding cassette protein MsbA